MGSLVAAARGFGIESIGGKPDLDGLATRLRNAVDGRAAENVSAGAHPNAPPESFCRSGSLPESRFPPRFIHGKRRIIPSQVGFMVPLEMAHPARGAATLLPVPVAENCRKKFG